MHSRGFTSSSLLVVCLVAAGPPMVLASPQLRASFTAAHDALEASWEAASGSQSRALSGNVCIPPMVFAIEAPTMRKYHECLKRKTDTVDFTVVGADLGIRFECWCENDMTSLIQEYGCCDHPTFKHMCEIDCADTCDSDTAKECLEVCPPICLEEDYAPSGCKCHSSNCYKHLLCIVEHGRNQTADGLHARVCDDKKFGESTEVLNYFACAQDYPMRTNWHRANSRNHCICKTDVKAAAVRHECCGADWAQGICNDPCLSETDCSGEEAMDCRRLCQSTCKRVHPREITAECLEQCFKNESACTQYKTCEPLESLSFEYLCEDGTEPSENGCCKQPSQSGRFVMLACPVTCEQRRHYMMPHGPECQCFGCPTDEDEVHNKLNETVIQQIWDSGQIALVDIARTVGLEYGSTRRMQEAMKKRSEEMMQLIQEHEGRYDQALQAKLDAKAGEWNDIITDVAEDYKACLAKSSHEACDLSESDGTSKSSGSESDSGKSGVAVMLIIVLVILVLVVVLIGAACFYFSRRSKKPSQENQQAPPNSDVEPREDDSTVVVGRPVTEPTEAAAGAPVNAASKPKGSTEN